jgi:hypothetical protein
LFRFRGPRYPPRFVSRSLRSRKVGGCLPGQGPCSAGDPIAGLLSRGRERDLPGSQAIHPVPLPRSKTPAESTIPRLLRFHRCCPRSFHNEGFSVLAISGLPRGFSTCCLRFKSGVATTHARLASGWLARLYREGVEPSRSQQKVSDHIFVPLFWIYPGARKVGFEDRFEHQHRCRHADPIAQG